MAGEAASVPRRNVVSVNSPRKTWSFPNPRELWAYRELLYTLIGRELKIRYKQTAVGAAWVLLQPLMLMVVYTIFFSRLVTLPTSGVPYAVYIFSALVPWTYFLNTFSRLGNGLLEHQGIITKVYFPRLLIPLSSTVAGLVDLVPAIIVLAILMAFYRIPPTPMVWIAPVFLAYTALAGFTVGIWLAALNVEYRDIQQVIPFLTTTWFLATPVFYPSLLVRPSLRFLYGLNPMVGVVDGFRWAVVGASPPPSMEIYLTFAGTVLVLIAGILFFQRVERNFADVI